MASGTYVFDDHYHPRQVLHSLNVTKLIDLTLQQYPDVVKTTDTVDTSSTLNRKLVCKIHKITIDVITKSYDASIINCANCKKEKQAVFIADTGASATFTFDKSDFTTYHKMKGGVETADKRATLNIEGYGTVFV
jgi:hypothetical protein